MTETPAKDIASHDLHHHALCLDCAAPFIQPDTVGKYLDDLRAGGVEAVFATLASIENSVYAVSTLGRWLEVERSGRFPLRVARSVGEIRDAVERGRLAVVLHMQGGSPIEDSLELVDVYQALGVRVLQLTYNARNLIGDGCLEPGNAGLSEFGRKVVRRAAELRVSRA